MTIAALAARLRGQFGWDGPAVCRRPALILIAGLPGTGKSYLAAAIAARHPAAVLRSDELRKTIFAQPSYGGEESGVVYLTAYALIQSLLADGYTVVFDATNLAWDGRKRARSLAQTLGVPELTLFTVAPPEVVAERLRRRAAGQAERFSSDADWDVHQKLAATMESRDGEPALVVDTTQDLAPALAAVDRLLAGVPGAPPAATV